MGFLTFSYIPRTFRRIEYFVIPACTQLRWRSQLSRRKIPKRKPKWLPMAPSKVFRIPVHPYVPPEEKELCENLLDEYYRKVESMRKLFQDELKEKNKGDDSIMQRKQKEEAEFLLLLEENNKENERIKAIREETLERLLQEKQLQLLLLEEEKKKEEENIKLRVDEIVKKQKKKSLMAINRENLDAAIEHAMDNPVNINYAVTVNGEVKWEGIPPPEYEEEIQKRISEGLKM